jgi:hypothetical protein
MSLDTGIDRDRTDPSRGHWLAKSATVARIHLRRVRRQQAASTWKALLLGGVILFFGSVTLGVAYGLSALGGAIASGDLAVGEHFGLVRGAAGSLWLGLVVLITARAAGSRGAREATGGLLWVTETRTIVTGLAAAEAAGVLVWIGLPTLVASGGFALGVGTPVPVVTFVLVAVLVAVTATAAGYPIGLAVRHVLTRFPFVKRYRTGLVVLGFLAYMGVVTSGALGWLFVVLVDPLSQTPMGWIADLAFLGTPNIPASPLRALGAVAMVLVIAPALVAATRVANRHWFADPVLAEGDGDEAAAPGAATGTGAGIVAARPRVERLLTRVLARPTAALVVVAYRRAYRAPAKLLYAALPFFFLIGYVPQVVQGGTIPAFTPVMLVVMVTWAAGVAFVLNPLGDQGSVLPATIVSGVSGRQFVGAHILATLLLVLPLGIVPAATALVSPLGIREAILLLVAAPVLMLLGSLASVGIGMAAPRFSSVRVSGSTQVVVPSKLAFGAYTVYLVVTATAGLLVAREGAREVAALLFEFLLPVAISANAVLVAAAVVLATGILAPLAGYRYAVSRFETVTLESAGA